LARKTEIVCRICPQVNGCEAGDVFGPLAHEHVNFRTGVAPTDPTNCWFHVCRGEGIWVACRVLARLAPAQRQTLTPFSAGAKFFHRGDLGFTGWYAVSDRRGPRVVIKNEADQGLLNLTSLTCLRHRFPNLFQSQTP
jgi:hypothetical protein